MGQQTRQPMAISDEDRRFYEKLGARIATIRRERGLTQTQLGEALGVSQTGVAAFEKGERRVPISALPVLAKMLHVSIEELVDQRKAAAPARRGPAPKLLHQLEQIRQLPRTQQRFVEKMLDTVLTQAQSR